MKRRGLAMLLAGVMVIGTVGSSAFGAEIGTEEMMETNSYEIETEINEYMEKNAEGDEITVSEPENSMEQISESIALSMEDVGTVEDSEIELRDLLKEVWETDAIAEDGDMLSESQTAEDFSQHMVEEGAEADSVSSYALQSDYEYEVSENGQVKITKYTGSSAIVTIPEKINGYPVTEIGYDAFGGSFDICEVTIPQNVKKIGNEAFRYCYYLKKVEFKGSIQEIGSEVFGNCLALESIVLPTGIAVIPSYCFMGCKRLKSITIPSGVTEIGTYAFYQCEGLKEIVIPNTVETIESDAFRDTSLTSVSIPGKVKKIGDRAFADCSKLKTVTLRTGLDQIGYDAFARCVSLEGIQIPNTVTVLGGFRGCTNLKSITIPTSVERIENYTFAGCSSLQTITIPDSISTIPDFVFENCTNLKTVSVPYGVTRIGSGAYSGCEKLEEISIPAGVTYIGFAAFQNCHALKNLSIPAGLSEIPSSLLSGCENIVSVSLSKNISSIETDAFLNCTKLEKIEVDSRNATYCSENGVLYTKDKTVLVVYPDGRKNTNYVLPLSVNSIMDNAFDINPYLKKIDVEQGNSKYCSINGVVYTKEKNLLVKCPAGLESADFRISNSAQAIYRKAFYGCQFIKQVTIPESVTTILGEAFEKCTGLEEITIPGTVIGYGYPGYTFAGCTSLKSVELQNGITRLVNNMFDGCESLIEVFLPDSLKEISYEVFSGCKSLERIYLPDTITDIDRSAFARCEKLQTFRFPKQLSYLGVGCFSGCISLKNIKIPEGLENFSGSSMFEDCTSLEYVEFPKGFNGIRYHIFSGCNNLKTLVLPESCTTWYDVADVFKDCTQLESVLLLNGDVYLADCFNMWTTIYAPSGGMTEQFARAFGLNFRDASEYLSAPVLTTPAIDATSVTISWNPLSRAQGYFIYRKSGNGDWQQIAQVEGSSESSYVDNTATAGATYTYTVKAYTAQGDFVGPCDETGKKVSILKPATGNITATIIGGNVDAATTMVASQNPVDIKSVVNNSEVSNAGFTLDRSVLYDIYFQKNGQKVQPGTDVQVSIPVPTGMNGEKCSVLYIDGNGGITDMDAVYKDGYMVFTTNHFSYYAIMENNARLMGDVTGDGKVNSRDLNRLYAHVNGTNEMTGEAFALGDVTGDGKINTRDLNRLYAHVNGTNPLW